MTRRGFLAAAAGASMAAASGWLPTSVVTPADAASGLGGAPPGFPRAIRLYKRRYENWSGETAVDGVWTCAPRTPADVVRVANWAWGAGYQVRPRGYMHNWAPYILTNEQSGDGSVVLLDTTRHLVSMRMVTAHPAAVRVQTGATMESLLAFLADNAKSIVSVPAIGQISVGGALAIGGHGAAVPAVGESGPTGGAFGSFSNLVLNLTAVVWNPSLRRYELRSFDRTQPETKALLTHLGRAFITEVTLQVAPIHYLRCQSYTDIPSATLFAPPARAGRQSFASFLDRAGRVEAILYPFAPKPWLKVWSVSPTKPAASRRTRGPYNYAFSDSVPKIVAELAGRLMLGDAEATPSFGEVEYDVTVQGLAASNAADLWGPAHHTQHYIKASTLRFGANGGLVLVPRRHVQRALSEFYAHFQQRIAAYQAVGRYPINGPVEIRTSGLDRGQDVRVPGAEPPALSALHPRADHPEVDTAIWVNMLSFPGTAFANEFQTEMEAWARTNYASYGCVRQEWTKGWAYTPAGAWTDEHAIGRTIPDDFRAARSTNDNWDWTCRTFNALDPHRIFSNPLLERLLP